MLTPNRTARSRKADIVRQAILDRIERHRLAPGQRITGENDLTRQLGVSRTTVREAIGALVQEGVLLRRRGSGTYLNGLAPTPARRTRKASATLRVGLVAFWGTQVHPLPYVRGLTEGLTEPYRPSGEVEVTILTSEPMAGGLYFLDAARKGRVDCLLLTVQEGVTAEHIRELSDLGCRIVFHSYHPPFPGVPCVSLALAAGTRRAVEALFRAGHRRVGMLMEWQAGHSTTEFLAGYVAAHSASSRPCDLSLVAYGDLGWPREAQAVDALLDRRVDAVVCFDDEVAVRLIRRVTAGGVRVPEDLAVIGTNDTVSPDEDGMPALTTMRTPLKEMGRAARDLLVASMDGQDVSGRSIVFQPELVVRKTALANGARSDGQ